MRKWKEYGTAVNLFRTDGPQNLRGCARRGLVREATKTTRIYLTDLQASVGWHCLGIRQLLPWLLTSPSFMSSQEKATVGEKRSYEILASFPEWHVGDSEVKCKKVLWSDGSTVQSCKTINGENFQGVVNPFYGHCMCIFVCIWNTFVCFPPLGFCYDYKT